VLAVASGFGGAAPATVGEAQAAEATITSHAVRFGPDRVAIQVRDGSLVCFRVKKGASTVARSCASHVSDDEIAYASSRYAVGGLAGRNVRAVIVRLTRKGTVWADLKSGAFYAEVPARHNVRAVVKVLRDGSRKSFTVTGSR
jgi:HJR/Mrr/RecB family endonuclease